jgi:transposase
MIHKPYPSDVSEDEWAFAALYLALLPETGAQRERALREVFNRRRYMVRNGISWRAMPNDLPQWRRSISNCALAESGLFRDAGHDLHVLLRVASERTAEPTAAILDSRPLRSGATAGLFGSANRWLQMIPVHFHDKIKPAGERQPAGLGVERGPEVSGPSALATHGVEGRSEPATL